MVLCQNRLRSQPLQCAQPEEENRDKASHYNNLDKVVNESKVTIFKVSIFSDKCSLLGKDAK